MKNNVVSRLSWLLITLCALEAGMPRAVVSQEIRPGASSSPNRVTERTVRLTAAQACVFKDALTALADQGGVTFIAEGAPLRSTLSEKEAPNLDADTPLSTAVSKVAAAYDYTAERQGGVFQMKKRYSDPRDLPGVTLEECTLALADVERVLSPHNPRSKNERGSARVGPLVLDFMATLTPEQLQRMQNKTLLVTSLTARQKALAGRFALFFYVQLPSEKTREAIFVFKQAPGSLLRMNNIQGKNFFGYEVRDTIGRLRVNTFEQVAFFNSPLPRQNEEAAPPDEKFENAADHTTLGEVVASLNGRGSARLTVDAALAAKPITVAGTAAAPPERVVAALAEVYGLRVRKEKDGTLLLTRRLFRAAPDAARLFESVRWSVPDPLLRAIQESPAPRIEELAALPPEEKTKWLKARTLRSQGGGRPTALRKEAARRLQAVVEPRLKPKGDQDGVPIASLSEAEKGFFAVALMSDFLSAMQTNFGQKVPTYIRRFDELTLSGGLYQEEGKWKLQFHLGIPEANVFGPGVSNIDYSPPKN